MSAAEIEVQHLGTGRRVTVPENQYAHYLKHGWADVVSADVLASVEQPPGGELGDGEEPENVDGENASKDGDDTDDSSEAAEADEPEKPKTRRARTAPEGVNLRESADEEK